ncbi:MAG: diguanylate cyclase [Desulfuromusa sp.]|nr:diguanylate cyclase [Desulfuromusa sp.]
MKLYLKAGVLFLMITLLLGGLILYRYQQLTSYHLQMREATYHSAYSSTIHTFELVAKNLADEIIRQDETLKLVHTIVTTQGIQRDRARGELYRKLYPMYKRVSQHSVRQLHFHFPDGRSMLRFHAPDRADDNLMPYRSSVRMANEQRREVHGYESGRVVHGFRHVYPLDYQGTPIGSVEISNSFQQLRNILTEYATDNDYLFIMLKTDLWHKLASGQQELYSPSPLHNEYLCENIQSKLYEAFGGTAGVSGDLQALQLHLQNHPDLKSGLTSRNEFALTTNWQKQIYSILFHSIKNVDGQHAAYIISIHPEPYLKALQNNAIAHFLIAMLFALVLVVFRIKLLRVREEQQSTTAFLQTIASHMGEGLYATDKYGMVTFMNPEASRLLGYKQEDVLNQDAHSIFHSDDTQHQRHGCVILNSIMNNMTYKEERAFFKSKDSQVFPVELTCTPFTKQGRIAGTITLFRNISLRCKQEQNLATVQKNLQEANLALSHLARLDGLTGVANRREFDQMLITLWKGAYRHKTMLASLMIDIDHFKAYNDTYGHQQGDECLRQVAQIIQQSCLRPNDFVARYGGEEFVVLMPETPLADACHVAERIQSNLQQKNIPHAGSSTDKVVTLSIGVCSLQPDNPTTEQLLVDCADRRLYQAKHFGRNQVCSYNSEQ